MVNILSLLISLHPKHFPVCFGMKVSYSTAKTLLSTHCLLQPMLRSGSEVTQKVLIVTAVQWENSSMLIRLLMVIVVI